MFNIGNKIASKVKGAGCILAYIGWNPTDSQPSTILNKRREKDYKVNEDKKDMQMTSLWYFLEETYGMKFLLRKLSQVKDGSNWIFQVLIGLINSN